MNDRLTRLETRLDSLLPMLATKGDVSEAKADIIKWLAGTGFAIVATLVSVLAFMLNRAIPAQSMSQAPASTPIVIYPPAQPAQSPPATRRDQKPSSQ